MDAAVRLEHIRMRHPKYMEPEYNEECDRCFLLQQIDERDRRIDILERIIYAYSRGISKRIHSVKTSNQKSAAKVGVKR
jgi:hypothetical protein